MPYTQISTRQAREDDETFFIQLYISTRQEEVAAWGWPDQQLDHFLRMQFLLQQQSYSVQHPDAEHYVIMNDSNPLGRMILHHSRHETLLIDLSLLPAYRNRGIGTALLKQLQHDAEPNRRCIRLHVFHDNPAQRLYKRLGFQQIAEESVYLTMQWQPDNPF